MPSVWAYAVVTLGSINAYLGVLPVLPFTGLLCAGTVVAYVHYVGCVVDQVRPLHSCCHLLVCNLVLGPAQSAAVACVGDSRHPTIWSAHDRSQACIGMRMLTGTWEAENHMVPCC